MYLNYCFGLFTELLIFISHVLNNYKMAPPHPFSQTYMQKVKERENKKDKC